MEVFRPTMELTHRTKRSLVEQFVRSLAMPFLMRFTVIKDGDQHASKDNLVRSLHIIEVVLSPVNCYLDSTCSRLH